MVSSDEWEYLERVIARGVFRGVLKLWLIELGIGLAIAGLVAFYFLLKATEPGSSWP